MGLEKVLLAAMSLDYGGAETHVIDLAIELKHLGFSVTVASQGGRLVPRLEDAGIPHFYAALHSRSPLSIMSALQSLKSVCATQGITLLHAHGRIPAWVCSHVQQSFARMPLVTTYHGVYAAGFPWNLVTRQGDMSIAVSEDIKSHFVNRLGFDAARMTVIPNGINTGRFSPGPCPDLRGSFVDRPSSPLIVNVSRLDAQFADVAIALAGALPVLDKRYPGIAGVMVGDGDRMGAVIQACDECNSRLGRRAAVSVGGQTLVEDYLRASDVVVAVARSALEALACERPVVFAGEGGLRGAFKEDMIDTLKLFNFTARGSSVQVTPEALAAEISYFLDNKESAQDAGRIGREIVMKDYSWDVLGKETVRVYEKAINMRQG